MSLHGKNILIVLGGLWHDFEGFANFFAPVLRANGCRVDTTYDLDTLTRLQSHRPDVVLSYTSLSPHREGMNDTTPERLTIEQIQGLRGWVQQGGGLLAAHSATVIGQSDKELGVLMGGKFLEHPPQFSFTVYPMRDTHPIIDGIEAFTVHDEFYQQELMAPVDIHMMALDRGTAYPMVWSRSEGSGRVAHVAMGHSALVWELQQYQRLMLQAINWVAQV